MQPTPYSLLRSPQLLHLSECASRALFNFLRSEALPRLSLCYFSVALGILTLTPPTAVSNPPSPAPQLLQLSECASRALFNCLRAGATRRLAEGAMASLSSLLAITPSAVAGTSGGAIHRSLSLARSSTNPTHPNS